MDPATIILAVALAVISFLIFRMVAPARAKKRHRRRRRPKVPTKIDYERFNKKMLISHKRKPATKDEDFFCSWCGDHIHKGTATDLMMEFRLCERCSQKLAEKSGQQKPEF